MAVLTDLGNDVFNHAAEAIGVANIIATGYGWAVAFAKQRAAQLVGRKWIGDQTVPDTTAEMAITRSTVGMLRPLVEAAIKETKASRYRPRH